MRCSVWLGGLVSLMLVGGCAGITEHIRQARAEEFTCKHCNCLMPSTVDPESSCTVCQCGFNAKACRGTTAPATQCLLSARPHAVTNPQ